jgi:cytochrome c-type biogenesis protein CcmE
LVSATSRFADFGQAEAHPGKTFHVIGYYDTLKGIEFNPLADANSFSFWLKDKKGNERKVIHHGEKPYDFERSDEVVIVGEMDGEIFHSTEMQMKCPSKYVEEDVKATAP